MNTNFRIAVALSLVLAVPNAGFANDFVPYEGKHAIQEGAGGEKRTVDGIDFWSNGTPPRKFTLLGYINDTRLKSGLFGKLRMAGLESSVAKEAKTAGGDAVILVDAKAETTGHIAQSFTDSHASATGYGNTVTAYGDSVTTGAEVAVQKQHSRYAVIKYVADGAGNSN